MAWELLFTSDIGIFSLITIGFILVMAVFIGRYAVKHAEAEERELNSPKHVAGIR